MERNGILNLVPVERQHQINPTTWAEFCPNPEALAPLRRLKQEGFILLATTNQPGLSLGYQDRRALEQMHNLLKRDYLLDDVYVCPHDANDYCPCRKPKPGLLFEAAHHWRLDLSRSFVLSDKWQDASAAHAAGSISILIRSPWVGPGHHDFILPNLSEAVERIIQLHRSLCPATIASRFRDPAPASTYSPVTTEFVDHCDSLPEEDAHHNYLSGSD